MNGPGNSRDIMTRVYPVVAVVILFGCFVVHCEAVSKNRTKPGGLTKNRSNKNPNQTDVLEREILREKNKQTLIPQRQADKPLQPSRLQRQTSPSPSSSLSSPTPQALFSSSSPQQEQEQHPTQQRQSKLQREDLKIKEFARRRQRRKKRPQQPPQHEQLRSEGESESPDVVQQQQQESQVESKPSHAVQQQREQLQVESEPSHFVQQIDEPAIDEVTEAQAKIRECDVQSGSTKYHVTVVRGQCCRPRRKHYGERRVDHHPNHERSLSHKWNNIYNDAENEEEVHEAVNKINKPSQNKEINKLSITDGDFQRQLESYVDRPDYDVADYETVFLLDRLSKVEEQLSEAKKTIQEKLSSLEKIMTSSSSLVSSTVEQQSEMQRQQLKLLLQGLQRQQDKQQSQFVKFHEEIKDDMKTKRFPCRRLKLKSREEENEEDEGVDGEPLGNKEARLVNVKQGISPNSKVERIYVRDKSASWDGNRVYSMPLKDEPGREENNLLNGLYQGFTALRQDLTQAKEELAVAEKRLSEELEEKENIRYELNGRVRQLIEMRDEMIHTAEKNSVLEATVADLTTDKESLERELGEERRIRDETVGHLTQVLHQYHDLREKHENQTILVNIIRSRMDDCILRQLPLHCEFEDVRVCGFEQDTYSDHLDWIRSSGGDDAIESKNKPKNDHTCSSVRGSYMTVNVSTRLLGQVARMKTPRMFGYTEQCIEFFYWISGRYVGTLNVYTEVPDEGLVIPVWRIYGNQGDIWIKARLNIPERVVRSGYRVVFEGIVDRGLHGDIAIDDFKVEEGHCDKDLMTTTTTTDEADEILDNWINNSTGASVV